MINQLDLIIPRNIKTLKNRGACFYCLKLLPNKWKKHICKLPIDIYFNLKNKFTSD